MNHMYVPQLLVYYKLQPVYNCFQFIITSHADFSDLEN